MDKPNNNDEAYYRLAQDLRDIRSPWYWMKGYVQVGCLILLFAAFVAAVGYLMLVG